MSEDKQYLHCNGIKEEGKNHLMPQHVDLKHGTFLDSHGVLTTGIFEYGGSLIASPLFALIYNHFTRNLFHGKGFFFYAIQESA